MLTVVGDLLTLYLASTAISVAVFMIVHTEYQGDCTVDDEETKN